MNYEGKGVKCLENLGNAIAAITDGRGNMELYMVEVRREAEKVWKIAGIEWEDRDSYKKRVLMCRGTNKIPIGYEEITKRNLVSLWPSIIRGTDTIEAEEINGDVVNLGRLLNIPTPYNDLLWHVADEMAKKREKPGKCTRAQTVDRPIF